jgi:hypothetical protein
MNSLAILAMMPQIGVIIYMSKHHDNTKDLFLFTIFNLSCALFMWGIANL